ncbi:InlB B-repeat-containing protein [Oerskovia turbata]
MALARIDRTGRARRAPRSGLRGAALARGLALAAVLSIGLTLVAAVPARAATPVGDASTPGVWGTHTVEFVAQGRTLASVEVATGAHAPRQPAPPASDGAFTGWFVTVAGVPVPFDVDTAVVTTDLTVEAQFADSYVVQFLAPERAGTAPRVLDTAEIANGTPVGEIAPDVPDVPTGTVFTGQWHVRGDASGTPYDFDAPRSSNLALVPVLAEGFAVSFVTDGTAIDPVFVVEPDTAFTQADLDAVPAPTRTGYAFTGWFADPDRTQPATPPLTATATLFAGWQGQPVTYDVSYWLEKPGIVPEAYPAPVWTDAGGTLPDWGPGDGALSPAQLADRGTFDFLLDVPATATAGTTVSGPTSTAGVPAAVQALVRAQLDPAGVQPDPMTFADIGVSEADVVVAGNGSTVVNVYLTRALWRVDYPLRSPGLAGETNRCASNLSYDLAMTVGGVRYYTSPAPQAGDGHRVGTFSARAKVGLDLALVGAGPSPLSQTDGTHLITAYDAGTSVESCVLRGWGPQQVSATTFQALFTGNYADAGGVDLAARTTTLTSRWSALSTQHLTERFVYVEAEDQAAPAPDAVLGPDGRPHDPVHVSTLYNNNKTTVRAAIPTGQQVFEQYSAFRYWASLGDRQVAGVVDGFTSYVGYNTGPNTQGNYFQLDQPTNRLYQLNNSGNTNDDFRYQYYSRNAYDLVFVTGGGSTVPPATGIRYESALTPYAPADPVRGDDVFLGWYTDSAFATPFTFDGATMPASNLVLYAKWLVDPHTVEFYAETTAPGPLADLTQTVEDQAQASSPDPLPPRPDGSTFAGWFQRTAQGYFVPYDFDTPVGSDLALYARWDQPVGSPYSVAYDGAGNTGGVVPLDTWAYDAGASAIVADGASLVRGGEVFVGWSVRLAAAAPLLLAPASGPVDGLYQAGHVVPVGGADVTLVATYADPSPSYSVTFRENGGPDRETGWEAVPGAAITYPGAEDVGFTGPGEGRRFLGWSTDPTATAADPAYDRLVVGSVAADVVLYAVWEPAVGPVPGPTPEPMPAPEPGATSHADGPGGLALTGAGLAGVIWALGLLGAGSVFRAAALRRRA